MALGKGSKFEVQGLGFGMKGLRNLELNSEHAGLRMLTPIVLSHGFRVQGLRALSDDGQHYGVTGDAG